jgi:hypothetical protein
MATACSAIGSPVPDEQQLGRLQAATSLGFGEVDHGQHPGGVPEELGQPVLARREGHHDLRAVGHAHPWPGDATATTRSGPQPLATAAGSG